MRVRSLSIAFPFVLLSSIWLTNEKVHQLRQKLSGWTNVSVALEDIKKEGEEIIIKSWHHAIDENIIKPTSRILYLELVYEISWPGFEHWDFLPLYSRLLLLLKRSPCMPSRNVISLIFSNEYNHSIFNSPTCKDVAGMRVPISRWSFEMSILIKGERGGGGRGIPLYYYP